MKLNHATAAPIQPERAARDDYAYTLLGYSALEPTD